MKRTHGEAWKTPEYAAWQHIIQRCRNSKNRGYKNYGGRGIRVCEEWANSYAAFLAYVGRRPSPKHSIDRYPNNDGNYEPGNVRWATQSDQVKNSRRGKRITCNGETLNLYDWAAKVGVSYQVIQQRLRRGIPVNAPKTRMARQGSRLVGVGSE